jgi:hypothetical protein
MLLFAVVRVHVPSQLVRLGECLRATIQQAFQTARVRRVSLQVSLETINVFVSHSAVAARELIRRVLTYLVVLQIFYRRSRERAASGVTFDRVMSTNVSA